MVLFPPIVALRNPTGRETNSRKRGNNRRGAAKTMPSTRLFRHCEMLARIMKAACRNRKANRRKKAPSPWRSMQSESIGESSAFSCNKFLISENQYDPDCAAMGTAGRAAEAAIETYLACFVGAGFGIGSQSAVVCRAGGFLSLFQLSRAKFKAHPTSANRNRGSMAARWGGMALCAAPIAPRCFT